VNTNPELEIFADDVKAQHGATIGQIEDEPLFYLRSRGIEEGAARRLLIEGFAGVMIEKIGLEPVESLVRAELAERF
jgi:Fe-S cluster assembly protein SufD